MGHRRRSGLSASLPHFDEPFITSPSVSVSSTRSHRYSVSVSPPLEQNPSPPHRDSVIEPDAYATFTSTKANPQQPTPYQPSFPSSLKLTKYAIHDARTGNALITIARNAVHMPEPFSSKPLLTLTRSDTGHPVGSLRFHSVTTTAVDMELSGCGNSRMAHDGHFSKRWKFSSFFGGGEVSLYWCKSKQGGWELKEGSRKGTVIARVTVGDGLTLKFERAGMNEREVEEVVLSAVAVAESLRRSGKGDEWGELEDRLGDIKGAR